MIKNCISNGIKISFEEHGQGEPLFLIMGLGAPASKWAAHLDEYKKHFRVIAIDNRGAGNSEKPVSYAYTIKDMALDVLGVMDYLEIDSAHFNGISMGGAITQYIAINFPTRVKSIILTSTFSHCCTSFRRSIELLRDASGQLDPVTSGRLCQWIIFSSVFQESNEDFMLKAELEDLNTPTPMPSYAYKAQCNAILGHNSLDQLSTIKAPTLIVAGDSDLFVPTYISQMMADKIPNSQLHMVKNGGHVQHWEQLDNYNKITLDFFLAYKN